MIKRTEFHAEYVERNGILREEEVPVEREYHCCNLHYLYTDGTECEYIERHKGGGILIPGCHWCKHRERNEAIEA